MSAGLTPRQARGLAFIRGYIEIKGCSPSIREITAGMGQVSAGSTHALVRELAERGHIRFTARRRRSIEVITPEGPSTIINALCEAVERLLHPPMGGPDTTITAKMIKEDRAFAENILHRARGKILADREPKPG